MHTFPFIAMGKAFGGSGERGGLAKPALYISVGHLGGEKERFLARIDTGADFTIVPKRGFPGEGFLSLPGGPPVTFSTCEPGLIKRKTSIARVSIYGAEGDNLPLWTILVRRGIVGMEISYGFLGLDVLQYFDLTIHFKQQLFTLEEVVTI